MGSEINLLKNYPRTVRNTSKRKLEKNKQIIKIAKEYGREYFDGERKYGYGGYFYNPIYWSQVVKDFINYYNLNNDSSILDIGCAKGFMLYEFKKILPGLKIRGIDISEYAISNAKPEVKTFLDLGNANDLPYETDSFDLIISIVTLHNLKKDDLSKAIKEINRVSKKNSYITLDAYENEEQKTEMENWNLTAETVMSTSDWKIFFTRNKFNGDYYWFMP